jgi:hypothetical protein
VWFISLVVGFLPGLKGRVIRLAISMNLTVKEGPYAFRVGHSITDVAFTADFEVTGEAAESGRTYFTETEFENEE